MHNYLRHAHGHAIAADQLMIMLSVTRHRFPVQVELLQEIDDLSAFRGDVYGLPEYSCCSETQLMHVDTRLRVEDFVKWWSPMVQMLGL